MELKQIQPMKGRRATQIEIEAMGAICKLQDELHEAHTIIRALQIALEKFKPVGCSCVESPGDEYYCQVHGGGND